MPEMDNVVPSEPIDDQWGNDIRDRTVQRYASRNERDTEHGTPANGDLAFLDDEGTIEFFYNASWRGLVPAGSTLPYAGATAPPGYLMARGQAVSRTTFASLFTAIGTTYGGGDGSTTFNVPDLQQRFPVGGSGTGAGNELGDTGGQWNHHHTVNPPNTATTSNGSHKHSQGETETFFDSEELTSIDIGSAEIATLVNHEHDNPDTDTSGSHSHNVNIAQFNSSSANPPFIVLNSIIKT